MQRLKKVAGWFFGIFGAVGTIITFAGFFGIPVSVTVVITLLLGAPLWVVATATGGVAVIVTTILGLVLLHILRQYLSRYFKTLGDSIETLEDKLNQVDNLQAKVALQEFNIMASQWPGRQIWERLIGFERNDEKEDA